MSAGRVEKELVNVELGWFPGNLDTNELIRARKLNLDDEIVGKSHVQRVGRDNEGDEWGGERTLDFSELEYGGSRRCDFCLVLAQRLALCTRSKGHVRTWKTSARVSSWSYGEGSNPSY